MVESYLNTKQLGIIERGVFTDLLTMGDRFDVTPSQQDFSGSYTPPRLAATKNIAFLSGVYPINLLSTS